MILITLWYSCKYIQVYHALWHTLSLYKIKRHSSWISFQCSSGQLNIIFEYSIWLLGKIWLYSSIHTLFKTINCLEWIIQIINCLEWIIQIINSLASAWRMILINLSPRSNGRIWTLWVCTSLFQGIRQYDGFRKLNANKQGSRFRF